MNDLSKKQITEKIYNFLPATSPYKNQSVDKLMFTWWDTGRSGMSLQLSEEGKSVFDLLEIQFYDFSFSIGKNNFPNFLVKLGKKIKCPYYVGFKNNLYKSAYIRIYDSKTAMIIALYGTFLEYIESNNL